MITREQYLEAAKLVLEYREQLKIEIKFLKKEVEKIDELRIYNQETLLSDTDLSVRAYNALCNFVNYNMPDKFTNRYDFALSELNGISIKELRRCRNVGEKTLKEYRNLFDLAGVKYSE